MVSLKINGTIEESELERMLREITSEFNGRTSFSMGDTVVILLTASKYYLRTNGMIGLFMSAVSDKSAQRIDFSAVGGGGGILGVKMGANNRLVEEVTYALENLIEQKGLSYETLPEE